MINKHTKISYIFQRYWYHNKTGVNIMLIEQQRQKVVILTTPTSMVASQAFVMATRGATSYDKAAKSPHSDYKGTAHCAWWQSCKFCNQTHRGVQKLENECYKTNQYLCSIPGHDTQASADFFPDKQTLVWVVCRDILHSSSSNLYSKGHVFVF